MDTIVNSFRVHLFIVTTSLLCECKGSKMVNLLRKGNLSGAGNSSSHYLLAQTYHKKTEIFTSSLSESD